MKSHGVCRTQVLSLALCGAATMALLGPIAVDTLLLFVSRAAVMAAFTTLYVYTPEVSDAML